MYLIGNTKTGECLMVGNQLIKKWYDAQALVQHNPDLILIPYIECIAQSNLNVKYKGTTAKVVVYKTNDGEFTLLRNIVPTENNKTIEQDLEAINEWILDLYIKSAKNFLW
jgi:ABC-type Fe3+-hydroxamate transport system substrate-binding protein